MVSRTTSILRPGDVLAGYRIDDIVGIGGMAVVYRAEQLSLGRGVALKVIAAQLAHDRVFQERFRREGKLAAGLEHPHIVPVYDSGEIDGRLFIAMRLIDGPTLAERMHAAPLEAAETLAILGPIADALDLAHRSGLVHRDVKPQNVLLTAEDHPYLADFGVAKNSLGHGLTATGNFVGSASYASPEQIRGETLTTASDVYSLTTVLYQCLTGELPFPHDTEASIMHAHLSGPPPSIRAFSPDAPIELDALIARGMAKRPQARFDSASALLAAARTALAPLDHAQLRRAPAFPPPPRTEEKPQRSVDTTVDDQSPLPATDLTLDVDDPLAAVAGLTAADKRRPTVVRTAEPKRRVNKLAVAAACVAAVAAPVTAVAIARGGEPAAAAAVTAGALHVEPGVGWTSAATAGNGVVLRNGTSDITVGPIPHPGKTRGDLPSELSSARELRPATQVRLGQTLAMRHDISTGTDALRVYVVPTDKGDHAIVCRAPSLACDRLAATVTLKGASGLEPGPDRAVADRMRSALEAIGSAREKAKPGLAARSGPVRAKAAATLADAHRDAAKSVTGIDGDGPAHALEGVADALDDLAAAARAGSGAEYAKASDALEQAEAGLDKALANVHALGYPVNGTTT